VKSIFYLGGITVRKARFHFLVAVLLLIVMAIMGCGQAAPPPEEEEEDEEPALETVRVAAFILVRANAWEQAKIDGMMDKIENDGLDVELSIFSCEFDPIEQINQIRDAITAGTYDVLAIHPQDSTGIVPVVQEALDAGLIVIGVDAPIGPNLRSLDPHPEGVTAMVGRTGWSTGTWLGKAVVEAAEGLEKAKVAYLIGSQGLTIDQERFAALEEVIKDYPHIEIAAFQEGLYRRDTSFEIMQDVFQAQPDINIVVSSGDQMTLGAEDAAMEAGLEGIFFIGNGCSIQGWEAINEKRWFGSYADIPYTEGEIVIELAYKAARGEQVPRSVNLEDRRPPLPPEGPMITQGNVHLFKPQW
jgi:ribose transport system substrate-binding protein